LLPLWELAADSLRTQHAACACGAVPSIRNIGHGAASAAALSATSAVHQQQRRTICAFGAVPAPTSAPFSASARATATALVCSSIRFSDGHLSPCTALAVLVAAAQHSSAIGSCSCAGSPAPLCNRSRTRHLLRYTLLQPCPALTLAATTTALARSCRYRFQQQQLLLLFYSRRPRGSRSSPRAAAPVSATKEMHLRGSFRVQLAPLRQLQLGLLFSCSN